MAFEFKLPDIGEGVHEGEIVQWLVKPGDTVAEDQPLVEVMTDKVTAEIPSPVSGVLKECRGQAGDVIQVGHVIAVLEKANGNGKTAASEKPQTKAPDEKAPQTTASHATNQSENPPRTQKSEQTSTTAAAQRANASASASPHRQVLAAPATRKLARELGVDLQSAQGSGPSGRVTQSDIRELANAPSSPESSQPSLSTYCSNKQAEARGEYRKPYTALRRKIAERLVQSKQTAPHFAYVEEVDVTELVALRDELAIDAEADNIRLSFLPFIVKAVIAGFRKHPVLSSKLDEANREIVYSQDAHIGIAVSTDQGLVVPVVKYADQKGLLTLARSISELAAKARQGKLAIDDVQGGTFTISSIGSVGGLFGIPIINYPEVAILGVNKIEKRPVVRTIDGEDRIVIRSILNLSISCDHRVVDGMDAALFIKEVCACLEKPGRLLLAD